MASAQSLKLLPPAGEGAFGGGLGYEGRAPVAFCEGG